MSDKKKKINVVLTQKKKREASKYFSTGVKRKRFSENPSPLVTNKFSNKDHTITDFFNYYQRGNFVDSKLQKIAEAAVVKEIKTFNACPLVLKKEVIHSRITSIKWHPNLNNVFILATKHGLLLKYEVSKDGKVVRKFSKGNGPGDAVQAIIFDPDNCDTIYTAGLSGRIDTFTEAKDNLVRNTLFTTDDPMRKWYCSLDIDAGRKILLAGDNLGIVHNIDLKSRNQFEIKLHRSKITHIECCKRNTDLMVTSSLDKTVKLWDRRMMDKFLIAFKHSCAVNNAEFSLSDSNRLLTTDQMKEVRVYKAPNWTLETVIPHPHRQFQHITQMKASWHPLADIIVIGRYPDPTFNDPTCDEIRSIDLFSATSGTILYQMYEPNLKGITSLAKFNRMGNMLLSTLDIISDGDCATLQPYHELPLHLDITN